MPLSRKQIILIYAAKARLGLTYKEFHTLLEVSGGMRCADYLDDAGFDRLMRHFTLLEFEPDAMRKIRTDHQVSTIRCLWGEWAGSNDERALDRWIERHFGVSSLRFANQEIMSKAIGSLKGMVSRRYEEERMRKRYMDVAMACLERFGVERAPTWRQIVRYLKVRRQGASAPHHKSMVERDVEVKAFVDEMLRFTTTAPICPEIPGHERAP